MKKLRVTVEGKAYDVLVEIMDEGTSAAPVPAPAPAQSAPLSTVVAPAPVPAPQAAAPAAAGASDITSPLAGKVVSIDVKVGQDVEEGAQVATIEAMKMNTYIYAPKAGRIASIHTQVGDGIEEGALIIKFA
jgi:biotin carboxyl carrier protein